MGEQVGFCFGKQQARRRIGEDDFSVGFDQDSVGQKLDHQAVAFFTFTQRQHHRFAFKRLLEQFPTFLFEQCFSLFTRMHLAREPAQH